MAEKHENEIRRSHLTDLYDTHAKTVRHQLGAGVPRSFLKDNQIVIPDEDIIKLKGIPEQDEIAGAERNQVYDQDVKRALKNKALPKRKR